MEEEVWRCACGYVNVDGDRCANCRQPRDAGTPATFPLPYPEAPTPATSEAWAPPSDDAPREAGTDTDTDEPAAPPEPSAFAAAPPPQWSPPPAPQPPLAPAWAAPAASPRSPTSAIRRTILVLVAVAAVLRVVTYLIGRSGALEPEPQIRLGLVLTAAFYLLAVVFVFARAATSPVRPRWTVGHPVVSALLGVAVGGAAGGLLLLLLRTPTGRVRTDPLISLIVSEGTVARVVAAALLVVVCAPVLEELLFRGLLLESLRSRGVQTALVASGALFALWHLRPTSFEYYLVMGILLGLVYWRRGLIGSIATHAAFNGTLLAVAVGIAHGGLQTFAAHGAVMRLPATWSRAHAADVASADLAVSGPSGAGIVVFHRDAPPGSFVDLDRMSASLRNGTFSTSATLEPGTLHFETLPVGRVVRAKVRSKGHETDVVFAARAQRLWSIVLATAGSQRAEQDFQSMLDGLVLP